MKTGIRLNNEVEIQRELLQTDSIHYQPLIDEVEYSNLIYELEESLSGNKIREEKTLEIQPILPDPLLRIDKALVLRILTNMAINALEATEISGTVKIWMDKKDDEVIFKVWNRLEILENVRLRIFQRNFSTKQGEGRGIGTYSMKLFGEKILGGQVGFSSTKEDGTIFWLRLPLNR